MAYNKSNSGPRALVITTEGAAPNLRNFLAIGLFDDAKKDQYGWIDTNKGPLAINPNGQNVGINESDPQARLHVNGTAQFDQNVGIGVSPASDKSIDASGNGKFRGDLEINGKLEIGTRSGEGDFEGLRAWSQREGGKLRAFISADNFNKPRKRSETEWWGCDLVLQEFGGKVGIGTGKNQLNHRLEVEGRVKAEDGIFKESLQANQGYFNGLNLGNGSSKITRFVGGCIGYGTSGGDGFRCSWPAKYKVVITFSESFSRNPFCSAAFYVSDSPYQTTAKCNTKELTLEASGYSHGGRDVHFKFLVVGF